MTYGGLSTSFVATSVVMLKTLSGNGLNAE
jgi:hypothetical protein